LAPQDVIGFLLNNIIVQFKNNCGGEGGEGGEVGREVRWGGRWGWGEVGVGWEMGGAVFILI